MAVIFNKANIISPLAWQQCIAKEGFDLDLDTEFDLKVFEGYLPAVYRSVKSGFEYYFSDVIEPGDFDNDNHLISGKDAYVSFITYSNFRECACAMIAAAVLCKNVDGVLCDSGEDFIPKDEVILWANKGESDCLNQLNKSEETYDK